MKNLLAISVTFLLICMSSVKCLAESRIINKIQYGGEVCGPVTIKCSLGSFTVYNGQTIEGNMSYLEAWDCKGNKILDSSYDSYHYNSETRITVRYYNFTKLWDTSSSSSNGNYYDGQYSHGYESIASNAADRFVDGWGNLMRAGQGISAEGVPFLSVDLGMSVFYGEFFRANFATPGMTGVIFYSGIGKDWIFDRKNSAKFLWHVGMGMLLNVDRSHFHLGLVVGENPICYNQGLLIEFVYHQFFGRSKRFGFVLGTGVGLGNFKATDPDLIWDVQAGLAVKLWQR